MKKIALVMVGLLAATTLSACGVSDADADACTSAGGVVAEKSWPTGKRGFFAREETHEWYICQGPGGEVLKVFSADSQTPASPDRSWWNGAAGEFAARCLDQGGEPWEKFLNKYYSYICVKQGKVVFVEA